MLDITTLAAWGEFLGGIAVVASLIYLASQIRQNSKLLRASAAPCGMACFGKGRLLFTSAGTTVQGETQPQRRQIPCYSR